MKKIFVKMLICTIIILCACYSFSLYIPVSANEGISTLSYENTSFSFKGTRTLSYQCSGMFLNVSVRGTASNNNNETITLKVFIANRNVTKTYTFYTDGQTHEFKNIYLGLAGGSSVAFTFIGANPEITINMQFSLVS
ncbi:MAG: hypothetical protein HFJ20_00880 [Clostridia bacterium]|nr:hypothetical protein [Clostridia bacterium]MCI8832971.1 hypothetical protein [Clostridia bacterium]